LGGKPFWAWARPAKIPSNSARKAAILPRPLGKAEIRRKGWLWEDWVITSRVGGGCRKEW
jgi:hypothetical protein